MFSPVNCSRLVLLSLLGASTALADTASDSLDLTVELTQVLSVTCTTAMQFGVTTLSTGRTGDATITLAPDDSTLSVGGAPDGVTTGTGQAASCELRGSTAGNGSSLFTSHNGPVTLAGAQAYSLSAPDTAAIVTVDNPTFSGLTLSEGGASFTVGAEMVVPQVMEDANLGGYEGVLEITIDDGV